MRINLAFTKLVSASKRNTVRYLSSSFAHLKCYLPLNEYYSEDDNVCSIEVNRQF